VIDGEADRFNAEYDCAAVWLSKLENRLLGPADNTEPLPALSDDEAEPVVGGGGWAVPVRRLPVEFADDEDAADEPAFTDSLSNALLSPLIADVEPPVEGLFKVTCATWPLEEDEPDETAEVPPRELTRLSSTAVTALFTLSGDGVKPLKGGCGACTPLMAAVLAEFADDAVLSPTCCACRSVDCVAALRP